MNNQFEKAFPKMPVKFQKRVAETLNMLPEKKGNIMSIFNRKRFYLVAAATLVILATTAVAVSSGVKSIITSSSSEQAYTTIAELSNVKNDIGFTPKIVENFTNGYTFNSANISSSRNIGEEDVVLAQYKSLSIEYMNNGKRISVSNMSEAFMGDSPDANIIGKRTIEDIEVTMVKHVMKFVPIDYVKTAEDKAGEAKGEYTFSTGDMITEVETYEFTFVNWVDDGICYSVMAEDTELTNDELFTMAEEIIATK